MISKGYKHTKLGILPIDWEVVRLGDIAEIKKDKFNPQKNKKVPCVELEHISQNLGMLLGFIDSSNQLSIKNAFSKGDVLFGKLRPYLRKFWKATFDGVCSSEIWVLQGKKALNDFLFYLVQTDRFSQIANATCGTKMPRADWGLMKDEMFSIPPIAEQEKIAEILSTWDIQIQNLESLITEKQDLKKGLCQTLLTAKTRLKGFSEDWQVARLGEVCKNFGGKSLEKEVSSSGQYRFISIGNYSIDGKYFDNGQRISLNKNTQEKLLEKNDLVMVLNDKTSDGKIIGSTILIDRDNAYIYNQRSERLVCSERLEPLFAWCVLNSKKIRKKIFEISQGGTQIYVNFSSVKNIQIPIPPLTEQKKIASVLSEADNEITLLEQKLESLKSQKRGLMQNLLNGKVRVKI